ncbi:hypothetical protein ILUMI_18076 [Ignelater luminosus]|nr:hypothetical protein ILUMI_18076 [Ignelater luminosus]
MMKLFFILYFYIALISVEGLLRFTYIKENATDFSYKKNRKGCPNPHERRMAVTDIKVMTCQPSCPGTKECTIFKATGCICREGYLRDSRYRCIKQHDCPEETK